MDIQSIITSFALAGVLGYVNVTWLQNQGIWSATMSKEDKHMCSILFTIFDYLIFLVVNQVLKIAKLNSQWLLIATMALTALVVYVLMRLFSSRLMNKLFERINKDRNKIHLADTIVKTPQEEAFDRDCKINVSIFDFSHNYIGGGYLARFSEAVDLEHQILIEPQPTLNKTSLSEDDMIDEMNRQYKDPQNGVIDTKIYLDTKRQLKYYLIYYGDQG